MIPFDLLAADMTADPGHDILIQAAMGGRRDSVSNTFVSRLVQVFSFLVGKTNPQVCVCGGWGGVTVESYC